MSEVELESKCSMMLNLSSAGIDVSDAMISSNNGCSRELSCGGNLLHVWNVPSRQPRWRPNLAMFS
jgi:hypothetical protein